jgi:holliday junction resolvase YEN1
MYDHYPDIVCWADIMQAPGEAEAKLAVLSKLHIVDAVITKDSDAVVFGATTILRM